MGSAMLLYDRVMELLVANHRRGLLGDPERSFLAEMRRAQVFDCTDVIPLMAAWPEGRESGISKRPPCIPVWAEWRDDTGESVDTLGGLVIRADPELGSRVLASIPADDPNRRCIDGRRFDEFYLSVSFFYCSAHKAAAPPGAEILRPLREVVMYRHHTLWAGAADMTAVEGVLCGGPMLPGEPDQLRFGQLLVSPGRCADGGWGYDVYQWPAFMAFSLLHCRNVVAEEHAPDPALQRRLAKTGKPPRVTFRTLRLEVPGVSARGARPPGGPGGDAPKVRFHLCRGHFKNLQHERYKNKGWHWWPATWRGDPGLGRVEKRYSLHGRV